MIVEFYSVLSYNKNMKHPVLSYILKNQVIFALILILGAWAVFETRSILISLFAAYIVKAALHPYVDYLQGKKFPKILAVAIPYIITLAFLFLLIFPLFPFFIKQIALLINQLPNYLSSSEGIFGFTLDTTQINRILASEFGNISKNALSLTGAFFSSIFSLLTVFVVGFYLLLYEDSIRKALVNLFPEDKAKQVKWTLHHIDEKLGSWMRGQMILSIFIGVITYVVLLVLGVDFALSLALIAALLEIVPSIGPTIAAIPAVIIASSTSLPLALVVLCSYIGIQLIENNILVPRIMARAVGLNPLAVILSITIGATLLGVIGALLSVPFLSFCIVIFNSLKTNHELDNI